MFENLTYEEIREWNERNAKANEAKEGKKLFNRIKKAIGK